MPDRPGGAKVAAANRPDVDHAPAHLRAAAAQRAGVLSRDAPRRRGAVAVRPVAGRGGIRALADRHRGVPARQSGPPAVQYVRAVDVRPRRRRRTGDAPVRLDLRLQPDDREPGAAGRVRRRARSGADAGGLRCSVRRARRLCGAVPAAPHPVAVATGGAARVAVRRLVRLVRTVFRRVWIRGRNRPFQPPGRPGSRRPAGAALAAQRRLRRRPSCCDWAEAEFR